MSKKNTQKYHKYEAILPEIVISATLVINFHYLHLTVNGYCKNRIL